MVMTLRHDSPVEAASKAVSLSLRGIAEQYPQSELFAALKSVDVDNLREAVQRSMLDQRKLPELDWEGAGFAAARVLDCARTPLGVAFSGVRATDADALYGGVPSNVVFSVVRGVLLGVCTPQHTQWRNEKEA